MDRDRPPRRARERLPRRLLLSVLLVAGAAQAAHAQVAGSAPIATDQGQPGDRDPTATHDGSAPPATEAGKRQPPPVNLSVVYTGEIWYNARGGIRQGWRYLDNLDLTLTVDADRALGWHGATLFVYGLYNNGRALSGDLVGDEQIVSNIETGVRAARLYQVWVEQRFAGDRASIKAGLYDLNTEFDTSNVGSLSLLSSHGIGPEFAQSGRNGPSIFPVTSLAVRGEYRPSDTWLVRAAVLDGVPGDPAHPGRTAIELRRRDGALLVGELAYVHGETKAALGYWRYTAGFARFGVQSALAPPGEAHGNDGAYLVLERRLTHAGYGPADDKRGLSGFVQAGFADARFNRVARYLGGGLVYTGIARSAGDDRLGLTLARASFGSRYRASRDAAGVHVAHAESVVELTYRTPIEPWLTLQPDVQYVVHPSAERTLRDALALGLRFEIGL